MVHHLGYVPVCLLKELQDVFLGVVINGDNLVAQLSSVEAGNNWRGIENVSYAFPLQGLQVPRCANRTCKVDSINLQVKFWTAATW